MSIATKTILQPFIKLARRKSTLEQELKDVKARIAIIEPTLSAKFQEEGVQSMSCDGYTVHLYRQLFAKAADGDKKAMYAALEAHPDESWSFLVGPNVNANQLKSRVRECELDPLTNMPILPDDLKDVIKISEVFRIGARKA